MKKMDVLKSVVILQAICMIVLTCVVVAKLTPPGKPDAPAPGLPGGGDSGDAAGARPPDALEEAGRVGDFVVTRDRLHSELMRQYGEQVLREMLVREAVRREAEAFGLDVSQRELEEELAFLMEGYESEAAFYDAMRKQLGMDREEVEADARHRLLLEKVAMARTAVTDDDADAYIRSHPDEFEPDVLLGLSWIVTADKDEAQDVLRMLENGKSFETLARIYSIDDFTAEDGGRIGTVDSRDPFVDAGVLELAAEMEVGEISGPVKVTSGWAVVRLEEKSVTERTDESKLREQVKKRLALAAAPPLADIENELLAKYGARMAGEWQGGLQEREEKTGR